MKAGLKIEFLLNTVSQVVRYFLTGWHNTGKTGILLLRKQEGDLLKWDVNGRKLEKSFQSLKLLEQAIVDYIDYYNNKRIKVKLKGLSPVQYRTKSFG